MKRFVPKEKLGKKARKELDAVKRRTWGFSPVTRRAENPRAYDRKKFRCEKDGFTAELFIYAE